MFNQGYNRLGSTGGAEDGTEFDRTLDSVEIRVIGALLEKERTTPEYYPLSLNALLNACNQKTCAPSSTSTPSAEPNTG